MSPISAIHRSCENLKSLACIKNRSAASLFWSTWLICLGGAELPPPDRLVAHPDGLSLHWQLPPEATSLQLPPGLRITVLAGADWQDERRLVRASVDGPAWENRIAERQELQVAWSSWRARRAALDNYRATLQASLPGQQRDTTAATTQRWTAAIDAIVQATTALEDEAAGLRRRGRALLAAIPATTPEPVDSQLFGLQPDGSAIEDWRAADRLHRLDSAREQRFLHLLPHGERPISLAARLVGGWQVVNELIVQGDEATWRRLARVQLQADWPWEAVPLLVDEEPGFFNSRDRRADLPRISIGSTRVGWRAGRSVAGKEVVVDLPAAAVEQPSNTASPAALHPPAFSRAARSQPASALRRWAVGPHRPTRDGLLVELERETVAVVAVHWEIAPAESPLAYRHLRLAGSQRPVPAGHMRILWQGRPVADGFFHGAEAGHEWSLSAGSDPTLSATPPRAWPLDPEHDPQRRQRHGAWSRFCNTDDRPRELRVVVALPISDSAEVTVDPDPAMSPASTDLGDGLRAWTITLPPQACQRLDWGCQISTHGRVALPVPDEE